MAKILLVEDTPDEQNLYTTALGINHEVVLAKNLEEALRLLEEQSFDGILSDIGFLKYPGALPTESGGKLDNVKAIAAKKPDNVWMTAWSTNLPSEAEATELEEAGVDSVQGKPATGVDLADVIKELEEGIAAKQSASRSGGGGMGGDKVREQRFVDFAEGSIGRGR